MQVKLGGVAKNAFTMPLNDHAYPRSWTSKFLSTETWNHGAGSHQERHAERNVEGEFITVEDLAEVALFFSLQLERASRPLAHRQP